MNSGKRVTGSFKVAYSEKQGWVSRKKAHLEAFLTLPGQHEGVAENRSDEVVMSSVRRRGGRLFPLGMTLFVLRVL